MEDHLRQTGSKVASRRLLFGENFTIISQKIFERDLASFQLKAVERLLEQRVDSFKDLSPRKLRAIQLTLELVEKKLPITLTPAKKPLDAKLSELSSQIPGTLQGNFLYHFM